MHLVNFDFNTYLWDVFPFVKNWCVMKLGLALPLVITIVSGVLVYEQVWRPLIFDTTDEDFEALNGCVTQQIKIKNYTARDLIIQSDYIKKACKKEIDRINTECPKVYDSLTCVLRVTNITSGGFYRK
jgi:hypothetical protein